MKHAMTGARLRRILPLFLSLALALPAQGAPATPSAAGARPAGHAELAAQRELTEIRQALQSNGAGWSARLSPVSNLTPEQKRRLAGVPAGQRGQPAPYINPKFGSANPNALPASFDWRNVNGRNYVTAVKNQGQCGSCWAFAATAALESKALIAAPAPDPKLDLSEQVVLSCSNAGSCDGGWPDLAAKFLVSTGSPGENYFPYSASDRACSEARNGWQGASYRVANWQYIVQNAIPDPATLKAAIQANGPLVTTFRVYDDFYYYGSGVYRHVTGNYVGNHAVLLVGWDDAAQAFIVKNSWDTSWGENGYFRIAYSEVGGDTQFSQQMTLAEGSAIAPNPQCTYRFDPASARMTARGGNGTLAIDTAANCPWTIKSPAAWMTLTTSGSGTGPGRIGFSVANNPDAARSLTLNLGDAAWSLTQDAAVHSAPPTPTGLIGPVGTDIPLPLTFSWRPVATAQTYYLYVRTAAGRMVLQRGIGADSLGCADMRGTCTLPLQSLQPGQSYLWYVLAGNDAGFSGWSEPMAFSTAQAPN
jgi:hypothetical protein